MKKNKKINMNLFITILGVLGLSVLGILGWGYKKIDLKYRPLKINQKEISNNFSYPIKEIISITNARDENLYDIGLRIDINNQQKLTIKKQDDFDINISEKMGDTFINKDIKTVDIYYNKETNDKHFYIIKLYKIEKKQELEIVIPPETKIKIRVKEFDIKPNDIAYPSFGSMKGIQLGLTNFDTYFSRQEKNTREQISSIIFTMYINQRPVESPPITFKGYTSKKTIVNPILLQQ
ncbi:MAG: hypothetical protein WCW16_00690 [Candidatus Magasanikbacteria bacterium]